MGINMSVQIENARYFHEARSPAEFFYEETLTKRNEELEAREEKKMKMRDFMSVGAKEWAELPEDDKLPFIERYKSQCEKAGIEPKGLEKQAEKKGEKKKGRPSKQAKDVEEKENAEPEEGE